MRIMAIDLGDARTGLAVSDAMGILCGEAWTMEEWDMERAAKRIAEAAKERGVERLVLGLPKNMDGSEGVRAEKSRRFKEMLESFRFRLLCFILQSGSTKQCLNLL